jgi:hypothetical protein
MNQVNINATPIASAAATASATHPSALPGDSRSTTYAAPSAAGTPSRIAPEPSAASGCPQQNSHDSAYPAGGIAVINNALPPVMIQCSFASRFTKELNESTPVTARIDASASSQPLIIWQ